MLNAIKNVIAEYVDFPKENITSETKFFADLQMDSFEILNMICKMEEKFGIELPTNDMKNIYTVGDLATYMEEKKAEKKK